MSQDRETNLALFIDFDNVALGARDARQRFDIQPLLHRLLEKGKIIVKKAYADWHYYKEHMSSLHEAAIELIEIPMPRISGKNSADIRLVVDAMDLCYSKEHIDTFVIVSGDSDFSPLVSKLRENNKRVIGIGVKNSSSKLLIGNCDEFIFYDDIYRQTKRRLGGSVANVPADKRELFDFLVQTVQSLLQENRGVLYSSLIKDTMTRKQPDFTERSHGFSTFGDLLDEARKLGLLVVERDAAAGGTWVVHGLGAGVTGESAKGGRGGGGKATAPATVSGNGNGNGGGGSSRSSRRRRRSGRGGASDRSAPSSTDSGPAATKTAPASHAAPEAGGTGPGERTGTPDRTPDGKSAPSVAGSEARKPVAKKTAAKKATTRKNATKKTAAKKSPAKKTATKKAATKKTPVKKTAKKAAKKTTAKKTPAQKAGKKTTRKAAGKKTTAKKATAK